MKEKERKEKERREKEKLKQIISCRKTKTETGYELHSIVKYYIEAMSILLG